MNFRDEYKKEITELSSDETARRIRESVMAQLEQSAPSYPEIPVKKKPLPLKRIAVIGGSIAACLVIGFTALAVNNKLPSYIFATDMAPGNAAGSPNPGMVAGGAGEQSKPQSIQGGDNMIGAEGGSNTEHMDGNQWLDKDSDGGSFGSNSGRNPSANLPEDNPPSADSSSKDDSQADYTDPGGGMVTITFEGDGFTLTDNGRVHRFMPVESNDGIGNVFAEDDLRDYSEVLTEEGERYIVILDSDKVILLNDKLEVLGFYAGTE